MDRLVRLGRLAAISVLLSVGVVTAQSRQAADGASCLTAPVSSTVGDTALLTWTCGGTGVKDWIGLYPSAATPSSGYVLWRYTGGNAAAGKIGIAVPLHVPTGSTYEWRMFSNNTHTRIASAPMQVVNPSAGLQVAPSTAPRGSTVQVQWANVPNPERRDWIAIYPDADTPTEKFIAWQFTDMNEPAAELPFVLPSALAPGTYNVRMYADNTYVQMGSTSVTVTTTPNGGAASGAPCLTAPVSSAAGATALLRWACGGTGVKDWIALYPSSATPNSGYVLWRYTGGNAASGKIGIVVPLGTPTGGSYEWRLFSNNGSSYTRIGSAPMQLVKPSADVQALPNAAPPGSTVQIRWANVPNPERRDWIAIYPTTTTPNEKLIAWQYTDMNKPAAEMPFVLPATLAPGTYNVRLFASADNTYVQIGSTSVTVTATCDAASPTAPPLPSSRLNLANWKLTLPVDGCDDNQWADEITQPTLSTFSHSNWFRVNAAADAVVFRARVDGARTSANTSYPRSELREMENNGSTRASWSNETTGDGVHTMRVDAAITSVPPNKPQVVAAQIHDGSDDVIMIRLNGSKLIVDADDSDTQLVLDENYVLGTRFTVDITATDGNIRVVYNGARTVDYSSSGDTWFFKAGCYTLSNTSYDRADAFGEVVIYGLDVSHS